MLSSDIRSRRMIYRTCRWYKCWYLCYQCFSSWYRTTFYKIIINGKYWIILMRTIIFGTLLSISTKKSPCIGTRVTTVSSPVAFWRNKYARLGRLCFKDSRPLFDPVVEQKIIRNIVFQYIKEWTSILKQISNSFQLSWKKWRTFIKNTGWPYPTSFLFFLLKLWHLSWCKTTSSSVIIRAC